MPEHLARFDWRDWREPAPLDDPFPEYSTWYLGLGDWQEARAAWLVGVEVPPKIQNPQTRGQGQRVYGYGPRGAAPGIAPRPPAMEY